MKASCGLRDRGPDERAGYTLNIGYLA